MGILEELVEETYPEQYWDCDSFMEMLVAYLPQSEGIEVGSCVGMVFVFEVMVINRRQR